MTVNRQHPCPLVKLVKALLTASLALAASCSQDDSQSPDTACKCITLEAYETEASAPASSTAAPYPPTLNARLKLVPPPKDRIDAPVKLMIDELHVFGDERRRLIETDLDLSYEAGPDYETYECGTVGPSTHEYPEARATCNCAGSYAMTDPITDDGPKNINTAPQVHAVARGDSESIDVLTVAINFLRPDLRSRYFVGIHIDMDKDGKVTDGDYFTNEFVEAFGANDAEIYLVADQLRHEKVVAFGNLDLGDLPQLTRPTPMHVSLIDASAPGTPRRIAAQSIEVTDTFAFELLATPDSETAVWQLQAWIDRNHDGKLDACDYADKDRKIQYSLSSMKNLTVPMAYAGGNAEDCEAGASDAETTD